ncbi:MAG: hypothetical protein LBQ80_04520 [Clostridium sp.]|jgi:flavin-dependent dehydrogenase|nr:hypothetical protein [Clostridium sp.]
MKILIVGAGVGGLALAGLLGDAHEVCLLEKDSEEAFAQKFGWYDDIAIPQLHESGFGHLAEGPFPEDKGHSLNAPQMGDKPGAALYFNLTGKYVLRTELLAKLKAKAKEHAELRYGTAVKSLLLEDGRVVGVLTEGGEELRADLTVDCAGCTELALPWREPIGLIRRHDAKFTTYRGIFNCKIKKKPVCGDFIYLKHMDCIGISWFLIDDAGRLDILIGRVGQLSEEDIELALEDLFSRHADWCERGEKISGSTYVISVCHPSRQMVYDGYAALGDSAGMTIPMCGSGIAKTLKAARLLAEQINTAKSADCKELWGYQYRYYMGENSPAKDCYAMDVIKRWFLGSSDDRLQKLLGKDGKGFMSPRDVSNMLMGKMVETTIPALLKKLPASIKSPRLAIELVGVLLRASAAERNGRKIPREYDEEQVRKWQRRAEIA